MIKITCFGAAGSVTGSNYLIETSDRKRLIVDCGLFQGGKEEEQRNWETWGYDPGQIKNLILTHAHIDHSGRIPKFVKDGFRGRIIASPPTVELSEIMLLDSAHVQEMEAQWRTKRNRRQDRHGIEPLYTTDDARESLRYLSSTELDQVIDLEPGVRVRLRTAGHILGSCIAELWIEDEGEVTKIVFSGDLGRQDPLIVNDPYKIEEADYLFIESTYGNRKHRPLEESKAELLEAIQYAVGNNEKVLIPAFAVERTQEILYLLGEFSRAGKLPNIPVYLDSPLAIKATEIFRNNRKYYDEPFRALVSQGLDPFNVPNLRMTVATQDSMQINELRGAAIIIAGNGMCSAGRIKHHLKHNLWRAGASLVIAGFQGQGTTGRHIVDGAKWVTIFGQKIAVRAKVFTIGGLSAHADQRDLLAWVAPFAEKAKPKVFVVHGEPMACQAFAAEIKKRYRLDVFAPRFREVLELGPRKGLVQIIPSTIPADPRQTMLRVAAELELEIATLKEQLAADKREFSEIDQARLQDIQEELHVVVSQ
jgi:metallo-beta-lactamase family protein